MILALLATNFYDEEDICILRKDKIIVQRKPILGRSRSLVYTATPEEVCVQTERLRFFGDGHVVVVRMEDGCEAPLCASCIVGPRRCVPMKNEE